MTHSNSRPRQSKDNTGESPVPPTPASLDPYHNLTAALDLAARGWSIIPLCHPHHVGSYPDRHKAECERPGKQPTRHWIAQQVKAWTEKELRAIWQRNRHLNVAAVCGLVSRIVMVDIDGPTGESEWQSLLNGRVWQTWEFHSGRAEGGRHLVFKWPHKEPPNWNPFKGIATKLDFIGEGHQSVVPPSMHLTGVRYSWTVGGPQSQMVMACAPADLNFGSGPAVPRPEKTENVVGGNYCASPAEYGRQLKRAMAWAARFEPSIQGDGGRPVCFTLADSLVNGYGLSDEAALRIMLEQWNGRCDPPWKVKDLQAKIESARKTGTWKPIAQRPDPRIGPTVIVPVNPVQAPPAPPPVASSVPLNSLKGIKIDGLRSATELMPKGVTWILDPYIPRGRMTLLVGKPNAGKSTFLSFLMSKAKRTLLFPGHEEDVDESLTGRLQVHGVPKDSVILAERGNWTMPLATDKVLKVIKAIDADLVLYDPLDSYMQDGASDNDGQAVREFLESLAFLARETQAAVVGIRHPGKGADNLMRGSNQWHAVPRMIIALMTDPVKEDRRYIHMIRDSFGQVGADRYYTLVGAAKEPKVFTLGESADPKQAQIERDFPDRLDQLKIEEAKEFLLGRLAEGEVTSVELYKAAELERLNDRVLRRAAALLGIKPDRSGKGAKHKSVWALPATPPDGVKGGGTGV